MDWLPSSDPIEAEQDVHARAPSDPDYWRRARCRPSQTSTKATSSVDIPATPTVTNAPLLTDAQLCHVATDHTQLASPAMADVCNTNTRSRSASPTLDLRAATASPLQEQAGSQLNPVEDIFAAAQTASPDQSSHQTQLLGEPVSPRSHERLFNSGTLSSSPSSAAEVELANPLVDAEAVPILAGRSLRQRTAKQLNPYSLEQATYVLKLQKQDWQDAVVKIRSHELSAEELACRAQQIRARGADDLDGWLVLEDGTRVRRLPEYERDAIMNEYVQPVERPKPATGGKRKRRTDAEERDRALRKALGATLSSSDEDESPGELFFVRDWIDSALERMATAATPFATTKKRAKYQQSRSHNGSERHLHRAASEPSSSSPRPCASSRKRSHSISGKRQKSVQNDSAIAIDLGTSDSGEFASEDVAAEDGDELPDFQDPKFDSRTGKRKGKRKKEQLAGRSLNTQASQTIDLEAEGSSSDQSDPVVDRLAAKQNRFALNRKKKKHLKGMMPGAFLKKAEADLRLMQRERAQGKHKSEL